MSQTLAQAFYCGLNSYGQVGVGHKQSSQTLTECHQNIKKIVCGDCWNIFITKNEEYFCAGFNSRGTCAIGNFNDYILSLTKINHNIPNIKNIFGGGLASNLLWITNDGLLYINGWNENQQIGIGSNISQNIPILIDYFKNNNLKVIYGRSGFRYNMVICDNGSIYACGYGDNGGNGLGSKSVNKWTEIDTLKNLSIVDIQIGDYYTLFLTKNGNLYACGVNSNGELGLGHYNDVSKLYPSIIPFFQISNICVTKIECGYNHSIAIDKNNKIYSWGSNVSGRCGFNKNIKTLNVPSLITFFSSKKIIDVKCGSYHSAVITKNNEYFLFGSNTYGECSEYKIDSSIPYLLNQQLKPTQKIENISLGHQTTILLIKKQIHNLRNDVSTLQSEEKKQSDTVLNDKNDIDDINILEKEKLKNWLTSIVHLGQYFNLFVENGFDNLEEIEFITMNDLNDIGINKLGHKKKLIRYAQKLKNIKQTINNKADDNNNNNNDNNNNEGK